MSNEDRILEQNRGMMAAIDAKNVELVNVVRLFLEKL
jgi:hypothetical protein